MCLSFHVISLWSVASPRWHVAPALPPKPLLSCVRVCVFSLVPSISFCLSCCTTAVGEGKLRPLSPSLFNMTTRAMWVSERGRSFRRFPRRPPRKALERLLSTANERDAQLKPLSCSTAKALKFRPQKRTSLSLVRTKTRPRHLQLARKVSSSVSSHVETGFALSSGKPG